MSYAQLRSKRVNASSHMHVPWAQRGVERPGSKILRSQTSTFGSTPSPKTALITAHCHVSSYAIRPSFELCESRERGSECRNWPQTRPDVPFLRVLMFLYIVLKFFFFTSLFTYFPLGRHSQASFGPPGPGYRLNDFAGTSNTLFSVMVLY